MNTNLRLGQFSGKTRHSEDEHMEAIDFKSEENRLWCLSPLTQQDVWKSVALLMPGDYSVTQLKTH